ncbi:hypothetical protein AVEN_25138-1 [Araneus ventricosus]|uniref:Uncharacterized protein n=1 Tax=Araneus ventricosus TaxID=182803 RepID=A0A4Y2UEF1_ARAVE|nr:hypothetical protein AVEN_25138-1 [Araneus ventricosus]
MPPSWSLARGPFRPPSVHSTTNFQHQHQVSSQNRLWFYSKSFNDLPKPPPVTNSSLEPKFQFFGRMKLLTGQESLLPPLRKETPFQDGAESSIVGC